MGRKEGQHEYDIKDVGNQVHSRQGWLCQIRSYIVRRTDNKITFNKIVDMLTRIGPTSGILILRKTVKMIAPKTKLVRWIDGRRNA